MALIVVPNAGQTLAGSRPQIASNFATINSAFLVDHIEYSIAGAGQHKKVTFPRQAAVPAASGTAVILGSSLNATTNNETELYFRRQATSAVPAAARIVDFTSAIFGNNGGTRLPSGIAIQWERGVQFTSGASRTINLNTVVGLPTFTAIYNVQITVTDTAGTYATPIIVTNVAATSFTLRCVAGVQPAATVTIGYLVIGV
jgi:hypothetical protein